LINQVFNTYKKGKSKQYARAEIIPIMPNYCTCM
jgi:hypothetical protein